MSRYLTPSKVALLCLASLYTDGVIPNTSAVSVLSFLVLQILPLGSLDATSLIQEFEEALLVHSSSVPGRSVWDLFLKKLWALDCCDALEVFFGRVSSMLVKTREEQIRDRDNGILPQPGKMLLSRCSPLGVFVRRSRLEFTRLQFQDSVKLWKAFIKYRLSTYWAWARKNPADNQTPIDINLVALGLDGSSHLSQILYGNVEDDSDNEHSISTKDVERLLEFQVGEMQRLGSRVPDEMKSQLEHVIVSRHRFLDSWRAGDYPSSRDRSYYQYALLNLAILQADFGCHREAVSAMQEAIAIARESHDMNCLNFCMSWLYHFGKAFPEEMKDIQNTGMLGSEKEGLAFLKSKAKETEMWSLLSTTLLSEAKIELQNGESLSFAFENIVKASHLNVTRSLMSVMGPQLLLQTFLFGRIGVTHLAFLNCEVFRECYSSKAPFEDHLKTTFQSCQLLNQSGRYNQAMSRINEILAEGLRSLKANQYWVCFSGILKLKRQLHRNNKPAVESLLSQLQAMQLPDTDISLTLSFFNVEFLIRSGDYSQALRSVDQLAQLIHQENFDVYAQVKLLCLKARIFEKTGQPQRGFSLAMRAANIGHRSRILPGLWEAIGVLARILLSLREFEAAGEIAESIMPQVLETEDRELTASSYSILIDANMGMAGEYFSRAREAQDGHMPGKQLQDNAIIKQKEYVTRALEYINCAYDEYEAIEDVRESDPHLSGDVVLANDWAAKYLDLKKRAAADDM
ncbi:hypothetical protein V8E54_012408 [Elaphomyces granulatus]